MKNNITLYLVIILVIVSLNFNECLTDNSRSKRSIKTLDDQERKIEDKKISVKIQDTNSLANAEQNVLRQKRDREDPESLKRQAELEVTKTELAELQRKIENEIVSLKNRYKKSRTDGQYDDDKLAANPRLVKIEVDTYEIESPRQLEHHSQHIKKREENTNDRINIKINSDDNKDTGSSGSIKRRMITYNDKGLVRSSEEDIERKIEALKNSVKEEMELAKRNEEIETRNLNDNMKNIPTNKCTHSNDVDKKLRKRSVSFEGRNKSKKEAVSTERKKSVSKHNDAHSNLITSESKIKSSLREERNTSHHDKSKRNKHSLHKNKHGGVVKKNVYNKNTKSELPANNLDRRKRNKQASKRAKAHVKIDEHKKDKHKHPHKKHYRRWDVIERDGRSVEAVENKNSNAEAQSDDELNVLNSQNNAQIASDYREAFGGFPKDPGDLLTRYKRIKRYKS